MTDYEKTLERLKGLRSAAEWKTKELLQSEADVVAREEEAAKKRREAVDAEVVRDIESAITHIPERRKMGRSNLVVRSLRTTDPIYEIYKLSFGTHMHHLGWKSRTYYGGDETHTDCEFIWDF